LFQSFWADGEQPHYVNWGPNQPGDPDSEQGQKEDCVTFQNSDRKWFDRQCANLAAYACSMSATPTQACGGRMLGCQQGGWVMGVPHNRSDFHVTDSYATHTTSERKSSLALVSAIQQGSLTTEAECLSIVHKLHPTTNGAVYSNTGGTWCHAVFNAKGVIFDPEQQSCLFEEKQTCGPLTGG
jgi:hypothetical protein